MRVQLVGIPTACLVYLAVTRETGAARLGSSDPGSPCPPDATVVQNLFDKQLNYSYSPELVPVQKAWTAGDAPGACRALIDYYKASRNGWWLRFPKPSPGTGRAGGAADMALVDTYDFYTVTATVPRDADGGLDWDFKGPNDDVEYMYALSRHSAWASLTQAWNSTGNIIYYNMFSNLSADWVAHNPAPSHPDSTTWRSLEAGIRLDGSWPTAFYGMIDSYESTRDKAYKHEKQAPSPAPWRDDSWPVAMVAAVGEHGSFLEQFCGDGNPNWRSMQYHGLANLAMLWPELNDAEKWLQKAFEGVVADAKTGVYPDGVETEETSSYHWVATKNFLGLLETAQYAGRGKDPSVLALKQVAESMVNYTAYAIDFTGMAPMNGDNNEEFFGSDVYEQAEPSRFNRPDWQYIASRGAKGTKPTGQPSAMFPWAGQFLSRSGWGEAGPAGLTTPSKSSSSSSTLGADGETSGPKAVTSDVWSFFDVGPFGASSHGHNDKLHVSVRPFGLHMLTDSGRFAYTGNLSRWRSQYAVLTRAHNTIRVDDHDEQKGPAVATSPIPSSDWAIEADHDWARGSIGYDGVQGTAVHTRALWFSRSGQSLGRPFWVVVDRISSDRSRTLSALWHTHPNNTAALHPQSHDSEGSSGSSAPMLRIDTQQDTRAHMVVVPAVSTRHTPSVATGSSWITWSNSTVIKGQQKPELQGWYSKEYDNVQESQATRYGGSCPGPSSSSSSRVGGGGSIVAFGASGQGSVANCTAAWLLLPWLDGGSDGASSEPGASASILSETAGTVTIKVGAFGGTETVVVPV